MCLQSFIADELMKCISIGCTGYFIAEMRKQWRKRVSNGLAAIITKIDVVSYIMVAGAEERPKTFQIMNEAVKLGSESK